MLDCSWIRRFENVFSERHFTLWVMKLRSREDTFRDEHRIVREVAFPRPVHVVGLVPTSSVVKQLGVLIDCAVGFRDQLLVDVRYTSRKDDEAHFTVSDGKLERAWMYRRIPPRSKAPLKSAS